MTSVPTEEKAPTMPRTTLRFSGEAARAVAVEAEGHEGELVAERGRFRVDAVGAAHLHGVLEFERAALEHGLQGFQVGDYDIGRLLEEQRLGRIHHVIRGEAVV